MVSMLRTQTDHSKKFLLAVVLCSILLVSLSGCATSSAETPMTIPDVSPESSAPIGQEVEADEENISISSEQKLIINEVFWENLNLLEDEDGNFSGWVELYNADTEPVELKGWYLSNTRQRLNTWMFSAPLVLEPGAYLMVFLSGKDKRTMQNGTLLHTNFSLDDTNDTVYLCTPERIIQDSLEMIPGQRGASFGRSSDALNAWQYFDYPTPGESNTLSIPSAELSLPSGSYTVDGALKIAASNVPEGYELRYTLNDGITFTEDYQAEDRFAWQYPANLKGELYDKEITLTESAVVKTRLYKGYACGPENVYTYLVNESLEGIPVVSLAVDPADLWDPRRGIYVEGLDPDEPNYLTEGLEVPAEFTYFSSDDASRAEFSSDVLLRIFGSATREFPNKSLAIISPDRTIPNLFFRNNSSTVYSLLLRTGATDFPRAMMRDIVTSTLVRPLYLEVQDHQQALLFINGQFWGITNIREKVNEEMLEDTLGIPSDELDLMFGTYYLDPRNGTYDEYMEMLDFFNTANLNLNTNFEQAEKLIDIDNFIDYVIIETFINNSDWPANNVKAWKSWREGAKWRWILYDTDASYDTEEFWTKENIYENHVIGRSDYDAINRLLSLDKSTHVVQLFQSLMLNDDFKQRFISRYEKLLGVEDGRIVDEDALLGTKNLLSIIDQLSANIEPYMPAHLERWLPEYPSYMRINSVAADEPRINLWYAQIDILRRFAQERPEHVLGFLEKLDREYTPVGRNLVDNGNFQQEAESWNLGWSADYTEQRITSSNEEMFGRLTVSDDYERSNDPADLVSFVHDGIILKEGTSYELSFRMKAGSEAAKRGTVLSYLFNSDPPYDVYAMIESVPSGSWEEYRRVFTMKSETNEDARLQFRVGELPAGSILYLDDVSIIELE